ncbi:MAG: topoisomerase [Frankiales bacterium]|nr:topoisomerase [Frankiales bacterium]
MLTGAGSVLTDCSATSVRPALTVEPAISTRRRPPARPTGAPSPVSSGPGVDAPVPVVGLREPCPCGSGKRYKACHGKASLDAFVARPFAGRADETEWVALREVVPAATAPLRVVGHEDRTVVLSTVLPLAWPAMVRADGSIYLGLQVQTRGGDVSRDLAAALEQALDTTPGNSVVPAGLPGPGPRLQDLLDPAPLEVTVHAGFDFWIEGAAASEEVAASMERANASVVPTVRLEQVQSAYWCRMRERAHLRWVLPEDEEPLLDAMAQLAVRPDGLTLGDDTRYIGSFRAHGLLVPVWDLPPETEAEAVEAPAAALRARLDEALASTRPLTGEERRARQGLLSRQLTLR